MSENGHDAKPPPRTRARASRDPSFSNDTADNGVDQMQPSGLENLKNLSHQTSILSSRVATTCLKEITTEQPLGDKVYKIAISLFSVRARLRKGTVALDDLQITKTLTNHPEDYEQVEGLNHVTVALRMNKSGKLPRPFTKGDQVSYLRCTDGQAYHLSEMNSVDGLEADINFYLAQVLHPALSEICGMAELGFDPARVADALDLDSALYKQS